MCRKIGYSIVMNTFTDPAAPPAGGQSIADPALFDNLTQGIAHCRVITDAAGQPVDYIVEAINPAYELILGKHRDEVVGRPITSIFPGVRAFPFDPIRTLGKIGLHGGQGHFEHLFPPTRQRLSIFAYSPRPGEFIAVFTDITAQRQAEAAWRDSEQRYRALFNNRSHAMAECRIVTDAKGQPVDYIHLAVNDVVCDILGRPRAELLGRLASEVFPGMHDVEPNLPRTLGRVALSGEDATFDVHFIPTGQWFSVYAYCPVAGEFTALFADITEEKQRDALSRARDEVLRVTFDQAAMGIAHIGLDTRFLRVNPRLCEMVGFSEDELVGRWIKDITYPPDREAGSADLHRALKAGARTFTMEKRLQHRDGAILWVNITVSPVYDPDTGAVLHYISLINDISAQKSYESQLAHLAHYDPLTGLINRSLLMDRLRHAMAASARSGQPGALLFLDLDHFKSLNDTLGHELGDLLLQQVGARLRTSVREIDTVARLGGDEFVVIQEGLGDGLNEAATQATLIGEKILANFALPFQLGAHEQFTTASVGIVLFQGREEQAGEVLKHAELAMYKAKSSGRNVMRFYDPDMQELANYRVTLEADLRHALHHQEFLLVYQPQVDRNGRMTGAEALVRWQHPRRGIVPPSDFIPLAEETGQILALGQWVLESACQQLAAWALQPATAALELAVNISARQFYHQDFVEQVLATLARTGANPRRLKLELTESLLLTNIDDTIVKMTELRRHGVGFALDDFGTGYSSLAYLKRLPLNQLKIDQSFVRDIPNDNNDAVIARTIVALAQSLGLGVIAEGVETVEQLHFLSANGCESYQGFLFSRPVAVEQLQELLDTGWPGFSRRAPDQDFNASG